MTSRRLHIALAALAVPVLALSLTGCFNGPNATTYYQATMNSGQGTAAKVGDIAINNATLVRGPEGSTTVTLIMSLTDNGLKGDSLVEAIINGKPASISDGTLPINTVDIAGQQTVSVGYTTAKAWVNGYEFDGAVSTWIPVKLTFATAGAVDLRVLVVEPSGIYTGIAPSPATLPMASASAAPAA